MTCVAMLVAMTSCMKDEVVSENKGHVIGFRTAVDTRGLEADKWSLPYFLVTALEPGEITPYFENAQYVRDNVGEYVSSTDYYWPGNDRRLSFYAYAPKAEDMGGAEITITNDEQSIAGFTVNPNISEQCDFIYAYNEGSDGSGLVEENGSVSLDFKHKLSKVFLYGYTGSERVFNCKGVRIGGVYNKGSMVDLADDVWSIDDDAEKSVFEKILDEPLTISNSLGGDYLIGELVDIEGDSEVDNAFMIPQIFTAWDPVNDPKNTNNGAYIAVYLQITTASGSRIYPEDPNVEYAWVAVPISGEWLTGYSYQYSLDFTKGAGYVAPDVNNPSSGSPVLGDATIKVVASLNGMEEATENMVVNPNMIGEWTATKFKSDVYRIQIEADFTVVDGRVESWEPTLDENGGPVFVLDENEEPIILEEEHHVITENIAYNIGGWSHITIVDGTQLITKVPGFDVETYNDYVFNEDGYVLIECYRLSGEKGSMNEEDYEVRPQITSIVPARADAPGDADVAVVASDFDNWMWFDTDDDGETEPVAYMWLNHQFIDYTIEYIGPDVEE